MPPVILDDALRQRLQSQYSPEGSSTPNRNLPSLNVTEGTFDDTYVSFIMYCNPAIPLETDTAEIRKIFRAPPKSDGKSFNTFTLFELIRKLELGHIKTWAQLAIDLGVEPPALDKGQSAQKVQQYAVRLKRWMHAMHVDAFFEFLLNKSHVYWTQVPAASDSALELGRDGVAPEEDLALRALLPEMKPKRGRRRNADERDEGDLGKSPSQRPRIDSLTLSEDFMIARNQTPATAHPGFHNFDDRSVPWSAQLGAFRWPPPDNTLQTPLTSYPQSAITPTNRSQLWSDEPRSAITPKSRSRRRHGPAVSSAWPSNGSTSSGKLRGRPPSNRSTTDGPFSTFPANPSSKDIPTINLRDNTPTATPVLADSGTPHFFPGSVRKITTQAPSQSSRPSKLQLQVPQREGGSVRLATPPLAPPPLLLVNGKDDGQIEQDPISNSQHVTPLMEYFGTTSYQESRIEPSVNIAFRENNDTDRTNIDTIESHIVCEILAAEWFGVNLQKIERCNIEEADKICKQVIKNLKAESSTTEAFLVNLSALAGGPLTTRLRVTKLEQGQVMHYECIRKMKFGSIEGDFTVKATVQRSAEESVSGQAMDDPEASWKQRYLDLKQQIRDRDEKSGKLKRGVLDALVAANQFGKI